MTTESLPPSLEDDDVVMHDEFRQIVLDAAGSYRAVTVLMALLRGESPDVLDGNDRAGLALLLESVHNRLELVVDGLVHTAVALGLPDARELA